MITLSVKTGTFNVNIVTEHLMKRPFKWVKFDKD